MFFSSFALGEMLQHRRKAFRAVGGFDADAADFFTRAGITDTTQKNAVNAMVLSLKSAAVWTKLQAIYPFVGGTSGTHSHNLKSAGFQLTFGGSLTHDANGITGNGSDGYASVPYNMSSDRASSTSFAWGIYCRSSADSDRADIVTTDIKFFIYSSYTDNNSYADDGTGGGAGQIGVAVTSAAGFFVASRTASNDFRLFRNGSQIGSTNTTAAGTLTNVTCYLLREGNFYSSHNLALVFIGTGLSTSEATTLNSVVETFQDALSRGVE